MKKALVFLQAWQNKVPGDIERVVDESAMPSIFLKNNGICDWVDVPDAADSNHLQTTFNEQWDKDHAKKVQITLTQADNHQYDVTLGGVTESYTSTTGQTAAQIVTALLAALSSHLLSHNFTDNGDGTYDIEDKSDGNDFSESYDANQSSSLLQAHHETLTVDPVDQSYTYSSWYTVSEDTVAKDQAADDAAITTEYNTMQTGMYDDLNTALSTKKDPTATRRYLTAGLMKDDPAFFTTATAEIATTSFAVGDALDTTQKVTDYANEVLAKAKQFALDANLKAKTYRDQKAIIEA